MLTKSRVAQPPSRIPDRYWEGDEPDSPNRHWLPTDHGQGLGISGDAVRLQADIGTLAVYVATKWRKLTKLGRRRKRIVDDVSLTGSTHASKPNRLRTGWITRPSR